MRRIKIFGKAPLSNFVFVVSITLLLTVCLIQVYPVIWMIMSSMKNDIELYLNMFGLPKSIELKNFYEIFTLLRVSIFVPGKGYITYGIAQMFSNSVMLSLIMPIKGTVAGVLTAYIIAKYKFRGRNLLISVNLFVMILPVVGSLPSQLKVYHMLGMYDNFLFQALIGTSPFGLGLLIYLNAFKSVPDTYSDAAHIDGAGHFRTFWAVVLPGVLPTIAVFYLLAVLGTWNNYLLPLLWLPSFPNLALGMFQYQYDAAKYAATLPQIMAGFIIVSVPSVVFYLLNQKLITSKMLVGGLKG